MPTPNNEAVPHCWKRMLLRQRITELFDAERRCAVAGIPHCDAFFDLRSRAVLCLEDGDLDGCEQFCIYAELRLVKHRAAHLATEAA